MAKLILDGRQQGLFRPDTTWKPPTELPDLTRMDVVSIDTETRDPELMEKGPAWTRGEGYVVGASAAWEQEGHVKSLYAPFRHEGGDNLSPENVIAWLDHFFQNFNGTLVLMNGMYDLSWLLNIGVDLRRIMSEEIKLWDIMWAEALLDENRRSYNLNSLAETYTFGKKDESLLADAAHSFGVDPKSGLWRLPARYVGPYAETDAILPLKIYHKQLKLITEQKLERVCGLEHSLVPCLLTMRRTGIRVDLDRAERHKAGFLEKYEEALRGIKTECGLVPEVFAAESVAKCFDAASITYPKTDKGKPSFTDDWLSAHPSRLAKLVTFARKQHRAANTFCGGMVLDKQYKGRVRPEFHPLRSDEGGTVTGRFSCSSPNIQQCPTHDIDVGNKIRELFLPEEGDMWAASDWKQQEPRLTVHFAEVQGCSRAAEAAEAYRTNPKTDNHNMTATMIFGPDFTPDQRKKSKTITLGRSYNMGDAKLCRELGLPTVMKTNFKGQQYEAAGPEGLELIRKYDASVPFVKELSEHCKNLANGTGMLRTLSGRLYHFVWWEPLQGGRALRYDDAVKAYGAGNIRRAYVYKSLNAKIQGSGADLAKISMRNLFREGFKILITMHDENGLSVPDKKRAKEAAEVMCNCVKLRVPLLCDIDVGSSWGEAKPLKEDEE